MDNMNRTAPALEIFEDLKRNPEKRFSESYLAEYQIKLSDAIVKEYIATGECDLITNLNSPGRSLGSDETTFKAILTSLARMCGVEKEQISGFIKRLIHTKTSKQDVLKELNSRGKVAYSIISQYKEIEESLSYETNEDDIDENDARDVEEASTKIENVNAAEDTTRELIRDFLEKDRIEFKEVCETDLKKITEKKIERLNEYDQIREDICSKTSEINAGFANIFNETLSKIETIKDEVYKQIRRWQTSLYSNELYDIAQCYVELYKIIPNTEKMILDLVADSWEMKKEEDYETQNSATDTQTGNESISKTIEKLRILNENMTIYLNRFETALMGIGLYVYRPIKDDKFDEVYHVVENDVEIGMNTKIRKCVIPGIAKKVNDSFGDDIIIKAVVEI